MAQPCRVRSVVCVAIASLVATAALAADNVTVFGEQRYVRDRGQPVTERQAFRINSPGVSTP